MQQPNLAQFVMFRGVKKFAEAKKAVHDFNIGRVAFFGTWSAVMFSISPQFMNKAVRAIHQKETSRLERRSEISKDNVDDKFDYLSVHLADLTILTPKNTIPVVTQSDK